MGGTRNSSISRVPGGIARFNETYLSRTSRTEEEWGSTARILARQWDVTPEELRAIMTEDRRPQIGKTGGISGWLRTWSSWSGEPPHRAIMYGVAKEAGIPIPEIEANSPLSKWLDQRPLVRSGFEKLGRAMYRETQKWFADRGITEIEVGRKGDYVPDKLFSSWSASWGGIYHQAGGDRVAARVPVKYVASIPATGFGTRAESEVVLLPRPETFAAELF